MYIFKHVNSPSNYYYKVVTLLVMDPIRQFRRKLLQFEWIICFIRSRSYIPLCRAELSRQGDKTQEESVMANSYDRRIRTSSLRGDEAGYYERFGERTVFT